MQASAAVTRLAVGMIGSHDFMPGDVFVTDPTLLSTHQSRVRYWSGSPRTHGRPKHGSASCTECDDEEADKYAGTRKHSLPFGLQNLLTVKFGWIPKGGGLHGGTQVHLDIRVPWRLSFPQSTDEINDESRNRAPSAGRLGKLARPFIDNFSIMLS